ncbi:MAG: 2OG-Fe(II) oxygenase family protein [Pseudomonadota bacterium]
MSVPLVDFGPYNEHKHEANTQLAYALDDALTSSGFVAVTNIGIDPLLRAQTFANASEFFAQPSAVKKQFAYTDPEANFGYQPPLSETLEPGRPADIKQAFTMRNLLGRLQDTNAWPDETFKRTAREFFEACTQASFRILRVFALALDVPKDYFVELHSGENVTMRYLHYPASGYDVAQQQMGAGAHTDYGAVTLLFQDEVGGLQINDRDGDWRDVPPIPNAVNLNTGDLMSHWSNGRYPSTEHRVLPLIGDRERQSVAFFTDPDNSTLVECLPSCVAADRPAMYSPVLAGQHIQAKIDASQSPELAL